MVGCPWCFKPFHGLSQNWHLLVHKLVCPKRPVRPNDMDGDGDW